MIIVALDGIFLYSLTNELKEKLIKGRVDKVTQPEKDEIILTINNNFKTYKLLISASAVYPKIHLTEAGKQNPIKAPAFCMVLRKHLNNSKILDIRQLETDRVLFLDFESLDELGFNSIYTLIVEIMGRHSNITLIRKRDNIIMDSIKHVTPEVNSIRSLYPGIEFIYPPASDKLNPFKTNLDEFTAASEDKDLTNDKKVFSNIFTGVSQQLSKELNFRLNKLNIKNASEIYSFINSVFSDIHNLNFHFCCYYDNNSIKDFSCIPYKNLDSCEIKEFSSPSELLENYYLKKDKLDRLNSRSADLQRLINTNLERCNKKINILNETIDECHEAPKYKLYGELITANIYSIKKGQKNAELINYYSEDSEILTIPLDENKTAAENSQYYFKKYNKLKKSFEAAQIQIKAAKEETDYLQSVLTNIKNAEDYETIEEIKNELIETGYLRFKKDKTKVKPSKPMHLLSSDGIDIYIGKNNNQNDYLTLKFADKHDTWLHTKNIPGSHVIIKKFGDIPEKTLIEAASLAAYYSKAKESSKVAVDYTEVKNVHKPNGAKPGMVIYYTNSTIYVTPQKIELTKAK